MPWGDYEWYSNQQASYTELPEGWGDDAYDEYVDACHNQEDVMTYEEWVSDNYDSLLYDYEQYLAECKAETNID